MRCKDTSELAQILPDGLGGFFWLQLAMFGQPLREFIRARLRPLDAGYAAAFFGSRSEAKK